LECDVLVIGAGPGGGSAALHAARSGLSVIIVEDHEEIGVPVHCGECISEIAVNNLQLDIPEEVISLNVNGIRVIFPDGTAKKLTEPGYVLEKHLFEQWICDEAVGAGASLFLQHRVTSVEKVFNSNNQFSNWKIDGRGDQFPITAKVLIDASGVSGVVTKLLKIDSKIEVITGFQYEMVDVPNDGFLDFYLWPSYSPHGYVWMIPKKEGRANVGLVTTEKGAIKFLNEFIDVTYLSKMGMKNPPWKKGQKKIKPFGGTIPISGPRENTCGEGFMLIGDAAGFTSPLFEGGSHLALKSGQFAAQVAAKAIAENNLSKERLEEYEKLWKAEFPPYAKILKGKDALYNLTEDELSSMGRCLPEEMGNMGVLTKIGVGLKILVRHPTLFAKKAISVLLSFGYSRAKHYGW